MKLKRLFEILDERDAYARSIEKLNFDLECVAPPEGMEQAGKDMAILGKKLYEITHSEEYTTLVCELYAERGNCSYVHKRLIEHLYEDHLKNKNIDAQLAYELDLAHNGAYSAWMEAKKNSDFSLFRDSLENVIRLERKAVSKRENQKETEYGNCLDDYERGGSEKQLDAFFASLKERMIPLVKAINERGRKIDDGFMSNPCPIEKQRELSEYLLSLEGLRSTALVLMPTEHPFTTSFGPKDVRVTTHYYENNFISNVFSTLHEGGHALFMQNEPDEFYENHADNAMSNAMHECISRFYENIIGRSEAFIEFIFPKMREISGNSLDGVTPRMLYEAVNASKPGLIRMEADELTYCLHIIVRYEIEKELFNGRISVDEVPELWNRKYKEYLGIDVPDDAHGCLQDVHWTGGFGYFPSYALGNAYGAQILNTMKKDIDVDAEVRKGNLAVILSWLKNNVFSCASVCDPDEWIRKITGESLDTKYYLDYLEAKYTALYNIKL